MIAESVSPSSNTWKIVVSCVATAQKGVIQDTTFLADVSSEQLADPGFRLPCQVCPEAHIPIPFKQAWGEGARPMLLTVPPEYAPVGGPDEAINLLPRREFDRIPESVLRRRLQAVVNPPKVGRNEPCPCGSGIKYKKCHERKEERAQ